MDYRTQGAGPAAPGTGFPEVWRAMDKQRKKIVLSYVVFLGVLVLFFFLIVGYAISQKHITSYADFFQRAADSEERFWIRLAFVAIMNLFAFSSIIFIALLIFLKKK